MKSMASIIARTDRLKLRRQLKKEQQLQEEHDLIERLKRDIPPRELVKALPATVRWLSVHFGQTPQSITRQLRALGYTVGPGVIDPKPGHTSASVPVPERSESEAERLLRRTAGPVKLSSDMADEIFGIAAVQAKLKRLEQRNEEYRALTWLRKRCAVPSLRDDVIDEAPYPRPMLVALANKHLLVSGAGALTTWQVPT